ncbi:hypothetical protein [Paracoccus denitrificans]|uniref:hypothetical protein n=1 Tax=Paracoccus denitrificans TaxID=266 RepID=UPI001319EA97|nr:hypothetical protein [Paracoccus denitrificans]
MKEIADALGISNLVKHLSNLGSGQEAQPSLGLLEPVAHRRGGRIALPTLSSTGSRLISAICGHLLARAPDAETDKSGEAGGTGVTVRRHQG